MARRNGIGIETGDEERGDFDVMIRKAIAHRYRVEACVRPDFATEIHSPSFVDRHSGGDIVVERFGIAVLVWRKARNSGGGGPLLHAISVELRHMDVRIEVAAILPSLFECALPRIRS